MKPFLALLRVNFKSLLLTSFNVGGRKKKKAATGIGAFVVMSLIMLYISGVYSFMLGSVLAPMGRLDVMLMLITAMAVVFSAVFTLYSAQSMVFSTKDIDLVFSLPVSSFSVMLSRVMALYLQILLMVEMMLLPASVAYIIFGGAGGILFLTLFLLEGIFIAFVPTLAGLIFGCIISVLVSRTRYKNLFTTLFSLVLTLGIMVAAFMMPAGTETMAISPDVLDGIGESMPPLVWITKAAIEPSVLHLILVILCTAMPFFVITWLFSLFFRPLVSLLSSHAQRKNFKLGAVKNGSQLGALLAKEARKFFGTPIYLLNSGFSVIMAIGASVFAAFNKGTIDSVMREIFDLGGVNMAEILPVVLLAVFAFFFLAMPISSVSISLEGKTLWILKEAPCSTGRIFTAKAGFQILVSLVLLVGAIPFVTYAFSLDLLVVVCMVVLLLLFAVFASTSGLFVNLLLPRMDADNDSVVVKQSASGMVGMLVVLLGAGLCIAVYAITMQAGFFVFSFACGGVLIMLNGLVVALLCTKGKQLFEEL